MEMNLQELYSNIRQRPRLTVEQIKPGRRIGIIYPESIHIITVAAVGPYKQGYPVVAVAKTMPGKQPAFNWEQDGTAHLMEPQDISAYVEPTGEDWGWGTEDYRGRPEFDIQRQLSWHRIIELVQDLPVVRVSKAEKRAIWKQSPLEKLVDDNTNEEQPPKNRWCYEI